MKLLIFLFFLVTTSIFATENYQQVVAEHTPQQLVTRTEQRIPAAISRVSLSSKDTEKKTQSRKKILVFVSFSLPEQSLRQWINDAHKFGANVIIRGLKNNSFKDTAMAMSKLLAEDKAGGVDLNPIAFQEFKITQVPAVVVVDENSHDYDVVYGNVSLEYALQTIANKHLR